MREVRIILLVVLISFVMHSRISYGATWTTARRLTYTAGSSAWPDVAVNGLNIYVVWHGNPSGGWEIYFKKSTDGGASWQAAKRLTYSSRDAVLPAIAVSGSNIYIVWAECSDDASTDDTYFRRSADGGANWQAVQRLTYSADLSYPDMCPAIAVGGSNVYVVWYDNPSGSDEVYFRRSADGGATWQAVQRLSYASGFPNDPAIVVDGSSVHIIWPSDDLYYKKSPNAGATWTTARRLTWSAYYCASPCLAVDSSGRLHVAWYGWADGGMNEVYYKKSPDGGATWTATRRITWTTGDTYLPDIAVDSSGNPFLVWYDDTPGNSEIYCRRSPDAGATWTTIQRLTFNGGDSMGPSIAINSSTVFVVWNDYTPGNCEIYFKRSIGGSI